jgi:hypothetical protein
MPQCTVVVPFWWQGRIYYGAGQHQLGSEAYNPWVQAHLLNGQPDPPGTPLTDPGDAVLCSLPPSADGRRHHPMPA